MDSANKKKIILTIALIILCFVFLVSGYFVIKQFLLPKNDIADKYKNDVTSTKKELPINPINFKELSETNKDAVAWITIPVDTGTVIDYPIMCSGVDTEEDFYINHDIDRKEKLAGSIYIQRYNRKDFTDFNTVIYGHNMRNGSMFGTLKKYRQRVYFDTNDKIYIYIPKHILEYQIVSSFVYDDRLILSAFNNFFDVEKRQAFIDTCKNPTSLVKNLVENFDVKTDDRLVTLSTCTSVENERYLVVGKLIKDTKTQ